MEARELEKSIHEHQSTSVEIQDWVEVPEIMSHVPRQKSKGRGSQRFVTRGELALLPAPEGEGVWKPVSFMEILWELERQLNDVDVEITDGRFGLFNNDNRIFGVLVLRSPGAWKRCVGFRSATDRTVRLGISGGLYFPQTDGFCLGGESTQRKQTSTMDLVEVVTQALETAQTTFKTLEELMAELQEIPASGHVSRSILVQMAELEIIPSCDILESLGRFRSIGGSSALDVLMSATGTAKKYSPARLERTHVNLTKALGLAGGDLQIKF